MKYDEALQCMEAIPLDTAYEIVMIADTDIQASVEAFQEIVDKKMNREVSKEYLSVVKIRLEKEMGNTEDKKEAETEKREKKRKSPKYIASQWSDRTVIKTVKEISKVFNVVKYAKDTSITMP